MTPLLNSMGREYVGAGGKSTAKERAERMSNEWDLAFCLSNSLESTTAIHSVANDIVQRINKTINANDDDMFRYVLISGIEVGESDDNNTKDNYHVHVCLILAEECNRATALHLFVKSNFPYKSYATPRNADFSYFGWRLHHLKPQTKIDKNRLLFEHGALPTDTWSVDLLRKAIVIAKKWGNDSELWHVKNLLSQERDKNKPVPTPAQVDERKRLLRERRAISTAKYRQTPGYKISEAKRQMRRGIRYYQGLHQAWSIARKAGDVYEQDVVNATFNRMKNEIAKTAFNEFKIKHG